MKLLSLLALASAVVAIPTTSPHLVHEKRAADPIDWVRGERLDANRVLPMRIGLTQQNMHRVEEILMAISHPESPTYGKHLSPAEVVDTFSPSEKAINAVIEWLIESGFSRDRLKLSGNKGWLHFDATTAEAEELLKTEYHVYEHPDSGAKQIGAVFPRHPRIIYSILALNRMPFVFGTCPRQRTC